MQAMPQFNKACPQTHALPKTHRFTCTDVNLEYAAQKACSNWNNEVIKVLLGILSTADVQAQLNALAHKK